MLRFLHAGDFHLDSPFSALPPRKAAAARERQRELLSRLRDLVRELKTDLVFLTGDLFDGQHIYPETLELLQSTLGAMQAEVFISPGNHDPYTDKSPYAAGHWPPNVHIFREARVRAYPLPRLGCTVYGSAFTESLRLTSPLAGLKVSGEGLHLGCFHGDLGKRASRYGPLGLGELEASGLHYAALGHIHARSEPARAGRCLYAYSGCIQGRGFDETGEKGVYVGSIDQGGAIRLSFRPLCLFQYRGIRAELNGRAAETVLRALLPPEPGEDICRISLWGRREGEESLPMDRLYALAAPYYQSLSLLDESYPPQNLWAREREESLCGFFLRDLRRSLEEAEGQERQTLMLALAFGLAALEGREEPQ